MTRELLQQALELAMRCPWSEDRAKLADALRSALAAPQPEPDNEDVFWLWQNGDHFLAFRHLYPCYSPGGDPMTLGEPFGKAIFRQSFDRAAAPPAPVVPDLKHKPTVQRLMDLARKFRATPGDLYDGAYKELQQACYEALSAAPVPVAWLEQRTLSTGGYDQSPIVEWQVTQNPPTSNAPRKPLYLHPAAPVVREPLTREQQIAIREAHCNTASDEYFGARPHIDSREDRRIYEAGFKEGWESGIGGGGNHG